MVTSSRHNPLILSLTDIEELEAEANQRGERIHQLTPSGIQERLPQALGNVGDRTIQLRHGLKIVIRSGQLRQTVQFENPHDSSIPLVAKFYLSGNSRVLTPDIPDVCPDYEETAGHHYLYYLPDLVEFEEWYERETIQVVMILLQPAALSGFVAEAEVLPAPFQKVLESGHGEASSNSPLEQLGHRFHQPMGSITPAMTTLLHQILGCPHHGMLRQMYLESKALDLLTLQVGQWADGQSQSRQKRRLGPDDVERLHHARDILVRQMEAPPSLLKLAQQVGLNDCKLKRGFRQLFGTTVFGYLHQARLERSRQLLATGTMSVTEVAQTVGYSSLPSFSKAFRKQFGSSPLTYSTSLRLG
ncbi:MAG: helix-turn-helix transcriptional regulator [Elainellaceae cyanobacterium]